MPFKNMNISNEVESKDNSNVIRHESTKNENVAYGITDLPNNDDVYTSYKSNSFEGSIITPEMLKEEQELEQKAILEEQEMKRQVEEEEKKVAEEKCYKRLHLLLSRSSIYAKFMAEKLEKRELKQKEKEKRQKAKLESSSAGESELKRKSDDAVSSSKKRKVHKTEITVVDVFKEKNMLNIERQETTNNADLEKGCVNNLKETDLADRHPILFYGGKMRNYQIEGYDWLKTLYEHGVNGILADEMGLGKTIQAIAFIAYLIEMKVAGPFFICGPLSTLPNWYSEFKRFTPDIPVILYHGPRDDRDYLLRKIAKKVKVNESFSCFPVILTSYQIALIDAKKLSEIDWKSITIDEAHRIKNFECRLVKALKTFHAGHRLLLTGTPLQNNLDELWSLLNFILPEIFDDLKVFQSWFDINRLSKSGANNEIVAREQEKQIIYTIHQILTPFLLRRTKADVELQLPEKKEIIVYAPLTDLQKKYYTGVLNKTIANDLRPSKYFDPSEVLTKRRKPVKTEYFGCENVINEKNIACKSEEEPWDPDTLDAKLNLKLQNPMMCLRKICNHPFLINHPVVPVGEKLVQASGKLLILDAMLAELKKRGHKVIIFTQFVSMLGILEDYCDLRKYKYCCLAGDMTLEERQEHLEDFKDDSTFIFLISTKAGGLGLNIISADTVIIYDSDWNPQNDLQAQDRCHRIGQTKPVVVYRYIVQNTIDERILEYATAKRKLEKVIIQKGRFTSKDMARSQQAITPDELLKLLDSCDHAGFVKTNDNYVISPEELTKLLDRSDMQGWDENVKG
ncbi:lymphoid-specific helicase [Parasteatoda tepidariorum]|uniref:lymphoid-specific helicase n=1 Tax=Parasteatoda tepidariorum TaxID=114398 RepID=UPI00077FD770|nr:lymphoid-specific helicase [Parasteatoda tepidariorum]